MKKGSSFEGLKGSAYLKPDLVTSMAINWPAVWQATHLSPTFISGDVFDYSVARRGIRNLDMALASLRSQPAHRTMRRDYLIVFP
jgi:hypothetical protein